jgi:acyl phosphate:glycerol-3-phosphate acyltransferase
MILQTAAAILIGYLLGSIPFSYIIPRLVKHIDIREKGSGNVGTLAVWRYVNPFFGVIALAADMGKGALAIFAAQWLGLDTIWICVTGFAAVAGHNWPVLLNFRGGKGAATIMGVLLAFMPVQAVIGICIAVLIIIPTSNVRLGMVGLAFIPLVAWFQDKPLAYIYYPLALVLFLAVYTIAGLKKEMARSGQRNGLIMDRKYHFWQTKKPGHDEP